MSPLAVACVLHLALLLPVVAAGTWCWHRYSAPLLLDTLDADEMVVGAVHRLTTVAYTLLALGFCALKAPDRHDIADGVGAAVLSSWAGVVFWLGVAHAVGLWVFLRRRRRHEREMMRPPVMWAPPPPPVQPPPPVYLGPPRGPAYGPPYHATHPAHAWPPYHATGPTHAWPPPVPTPPRR